MTCTDHTFPEEREPSGRLILAPCLTCGLPAMEAMADLKRRLAAFGSEPAAWQVVSVLGEPVDIRDSSASAHFHMDRLNELRIDGRPYSVRPLYTGPA